MNTKIVQNSSHRAGEVELQVRGRILPQLGDALELEAAIIHKTEADRYLVINTAGASWDTAPAAFKVSPGPREAGILRIALGPQVTSSLRANVQYRLRLRVPGGSWGEEVLVMPSTVRLVSQAPKSSVPGQIEVTELEPIPPRAQAEAEASASEPPKSPTAPTRHAEREPSRKLVLGFVGMLVALLGGGWVLWGRSSDAGPQTVGACRQLLLTDPPAEQARSAALDLAKAGRLLDCQFLMLKHAASKGDAVSARLLGAFYDPETWSKDKSPMPEPNATEAARWLGQAAEAGDPEAQYRYAMLLKLGRLDEPDAQQRAQALLRKAAERGHGPAKAALESR